MHTSAKLSRRLRLEHLEPRLALSASDCGCGGGLGVYNESDVPLAVSSAPVPESFETTGLPLETFTGTLSAYALDFKDGSYRTDYHLKETSGSTQLVFQGDIPQDLLTGFEIEVVGYHDGDSLLVEQFTLVDTADATGLGDANLGRDSEEVAAAVFNRDTIVFIVNFQDSSVTCTESELDQLILTAPDSVAAFLNEASYGETTIQGSVLPPVTIPFNSTDPCDFPSWAIAAQQAATAAYGTNFDDLDNVIYVHPAAASCGVSGIASIGGVDSWNFGACTSKFVFAHELGHNIGFEHANTLDEEGGDHSSIMGLHDAVVHFTAWEKGIAGWLPEERVAIAATEGTYTIHAQENLNGTLPLGLVKSFVGSDSYVISFRAPIGFDTALAPQFQNAVTIHSVGQLSNLRATLSDGEVYSDEANNFYVKMVSHTADSATIDISFTPFSTDSADFDGDGDVDGRDFLAWQRGGSPNPLSSGDLELWREEYGTSQLSVVSGQLLGDESAFSLGGSLAVSRRETASDVETVVRDLYTEEVDRALEELVAVPGRNVIGFGEMVARRGENKLRNADWGIKNQF